MPPFKDITGEQHGNLVVLGLSDHKYIIPKTGKQCFCGGCNASYAEQLKT